MGDAFFNDNSNVVMAFKTEAISAKRGLEKRKKRKGKTFYIQLKYLRKQLSIPFFFWWWGESELKTKCLEVVVKQFTPNHLWTRLHRTCLRQAI